MERLTHGFPPLKDEYSRILILGSFPSVKSRAEAFFYMHPKNRFWDVLSAVTGTDFTGADIAAKRRLLQAQGIALYDVIEACEIVGSADASIHNVAPADIGALLAGTKIARILVNGGTAWKLFERYDRVFLPLARRMPSTSPANARASLADLIAAWRTGFETEGRG
jgi:hypoxanthine-DNA glycosylase